MSDMKVDVAVRGTDTLGECPLWDDRARTLYWIDTRAPALYRWAPDGQKRAWPMKELVGSFAFRQDGGLLLGLQSGVYTFDLETGELHPFAQPELDKPANRMNDGRCDRAGRFWVGTMSDVTREPKGSLYRIEPGGSCDRLLQDIVVPNSITWSPDSKTMYFADTYRHSIWTFDYDLDAGAISNRRLFAETNPGRPDGSAMDSEGCLWNCEYAGGRVVRYTPSGRADRVVQIPADNPTCCAFGGSDLRTLFVTSARQRLTREELQRQPLAGSVFAVSVGVSGLPEARFGAPKP